MCAIASLSISNTMPANTMFISACGQATELRHVVLDHDAGSDRSGARTAPIRVL